MSTEYLMLRRKDDDVMLRLRPIVIRSGLITRCHDKSLSQLTLNKKMRPHYRLDHKLGLGLPSTEIDTYDTCCLIRQLNSLPPNSQFFDLHLIFCKYHHGK